MKILKSGCSFWFSMCDFALGIQVPVPQCHFSVLSTLARSRVEPLMERESIWSRLLNARKETSLV